LLDVGNGGVDKRDAVGEEVGFCHGVDGSGFAWIQS
jgi:hypothetical protein